MNTIDNTVTAYKAYEWNAKAANKIYFDFASNYVAELERKLDEMRYHAALLATLDLEDEANHAMLCNVENNICLLEAVLATAKDYLNM